MPRGVINLVLRNELTVHILNNSQKYVDLLEAYTEPIPMSGCIIFDGPHGRCDDALYGLVNVVAGKRMGAHVLAYILAFGKLKDTHEVMHKCDVRRCVAPHHLTSGTRKENLADMRTKGRSSAGQPSKVRGSMHKLSVLTEVQARDIKNAKSHTEARALGQDFGCSKSTVSRIYYRSMWKWL